MQRNASWLVAAGFAAAAMLISNAPVQAHGGGHGGGHAGGHAGGFHAGGFHGGGFNGGGFNGGFHGGSFYHGGFYHGGYGGFYRPYGFYPYGFYRPYYGYGYGIGAFGLGLGLGLGLGGLYAPYYGSYAYPIAPGYVYNPYPTAVIVNAPPGGTIGGPGVQGVQPAPQQTPQRPPPDNAGHLQLIVPENAELFIDGQKIAQTGTTREVVSPTLTPGTRYTYKISVGCS